MKSVASSCAKTNRLATGEEVDATSLALLHKLDTNHQAGWTEVIQSMNFTHSSCKAWQTINLLTGRKLIPPRRVVMVVIFSLQGSKHRCQTYQETS